MHLYLVRHGESESNLPSYEGKHIVDVALTERGNQQAKALGEWLKKGKLLPPDVLYCSTLRRTRETVAYLTESLNLEPIFDDRLREIGNNLNDHSPIPVENTIDYNNYWASERPFSSSTTIINGENLIHFRARLGMMLFDLIAQHAEQTVMVVCHGFVIDAMLDIAYNVGPFRNMEVWTSNTGVVHLQYISHPGREQWRMHFHNRVEHLSKIGGLGLTLDSPKD